MSWFVSQISYNAIISHVIFMCIDFVVTLLQFYGLTSKVMIRDKPFISVKYTKYVQYITPRNTPNMGNCIAQFGVMIYTQERHQI